MSFKLSGSKRVGMWLVTLLGLQAQSLLAADWSQFRGPNGSAVSVEGQLPSEWSETKNLLWKTNLPGPGSSSPIIVGDKVFLTSYSGYGTSQAEGASRDKLQRHLICASLSTGKILWDQVSKATVAEDNYGGFIREHGYATSTPASDGERVYVFYGKSGVLAYDLDGKQLWQTSVGTGSAQNNWGSGSSPIVYKNLVVVNASAESHALIALDKFTGKEVWKTPADNLVGTWATPVLVNTAAGKTELVLSVPYEVWGFNPDDGAFLWYAEGIADRTICGSVITRDDIVYAVGGRSGSAVAIRAGGKQEATASQTLWKKSLTSYVPSPVLSGSRIFCVNERGVLGCLSAKDGSQIFQRRLPDAGGIYASPVAADGKLYIVTRTRGTLVLDVDGNGDVVSQNEFASDSSDFNAGPAIVPGRLLLRSNQALYCVGTTSAR